MKGDNFCSIRETKQRKGVKAQKEIVGADGSNGKRRHVLRKGEKCR